MAFIFGGDTGETYESLQRKRKVADALIAQSARTPRNMGEGLTAIGNALAGGLLAMKARDGERKGKAEFGKIYDSLIAGGSFGTPAAGAAVAPPAAPSAAPMPVVNDPPLDKLDGVHPALAAVWKRAAEISPLPIGLTEGMRSKDRQAELVADGKSQTMNSHHLGGRAIDFHVLGDDDAANWDFENYQNVYDNAFVKAAEELGVPIEWGGNWKSLKDGPHIQLQPGWDGEATQPTASPAPQVQASPGIDPRLLAALGNPYASPQQQAVIQALVQQQILHNAPPKPITPFQQKQLELQEKDYALRVQNANKPDPSPIAALEARAAAAGFVKGTPEYQQFMASGGRVADPATSPIADLEARAQAAGLTPGTPEYQSFMLNNGAVTKPDASPIADLEARAQAAGLTPGTPEYQQFMLNDGKQPEAAGPPKVHKITRTDGSEVSYQWDDASRSWVPFDAPEGGTTATAKELTESQARMALFSSFQTETQPVFDSLEEQYDPANLGDAVARAAPIGEAYFKSSEGQIYDASAAQWAEGALRLATGAAATQDEITRMRNTYFATAGDTPATVAWKRELRASYMRSIERARGLSPDGKLPDPREYIKAYGAGKPMPRPEEAIPPVPEGIGVSAEEWPRLWKNMSPEDRALWQN